jgi:Mrp family chromosome partitioning ATPase
LDAFAGQFDLIIMDTPALAESADAQILAAHAGAVIMVVRKNHTKVPELRESFENLTQSGVRILGSVVNDF